MEKIEKTIVRTLKDVKEDFDDVKNEIKKRNEEIKQLMQKAAKYKLEAYEMTKYKTVHAVEAVSFGIYGNYVDRHTFDMPRKIEGRYHSGCEREDRIIVCSDEYAVEGALENDYGFKI